MKVVILAGGYGTRLAEYTSDIPKPLVKIGNEPILTHIMRFFSSFGFNSFIIAAGYKQKVIFDYYKDSIRLQKEFPSLKIYNVSSRSKVFDWNVPNEWNVSDAYVLDKKNSQIEIEVESINELRKLNKKIILLINKDDNYEKDNYFNNLCLSNFNCFWSNFNIC